MKYDDFEKLLYDDLSWRKKEISELFLLASDKKNEVLFKSMLLILYAHWEGYIKKSSMLYIKYICEKKVNICDLTSNFKAMVLKAHIAPIIDGKEKLNLTSEMQFMDKYHRMEQKRFKISIDIHNEFDSIIINTHDNLNPKVFKNILNILGVKYIDSFSTREQYINSSLLGNRNAIGHGSKFNKDTQDNFDLCIHDVEKLKSFIVETLDFYTNMLLHYIEKEFYLEANEGIKEQYNDEKNEEFKEIIKRIDTLHEQMQIS